MAGSGTAAVLLPGAYYFLRDTQLPPIAALRAARVPMAIATDCNPGTSYTTSMPFAIALAVRDMGMTPAQALWSATAGGAAALRRDDVGTLTPGARADLVLLDAPPRVHLAYRPGVPLVQRVWKDGTLVVG
jgi:imidazolonepropionase